jgi:hypothetical protein
MKSQPTVHQLRLEGKQVKITHLRQYFKFNPKTGKKETHLLSYEEHRDKYPDFYLDARGGCTRITLAESKDSTNSVTVDAECSIHDHYIRKIGVKVAIGRALQIFNTK